MTATVAARLLAAAAPDLGDHLRRNGPLPWQGGTGRLIDTVRAAGLAGRGGAAFPTWRKLAAVATAAGTRGRPVVIGNGAEGEPASGKDRLLLTEAPHLVLDGLQLAAEATGAGRAVLYAPGPVLLAVRRAVAERQAATVDSVRVEVVAAPDAFIAGEESAVVAAVEGRPALPRDTWRRVVEAGVRGRPTLVQNVETLAHLAQLARYGEGWFRAAGTAEEPGTFLTTVSGAVGRPGVYELAWGTPLAALLELAGGAAGPAGAVLVGGYHGSWLGPDAARGAVLSRAGLAPLGAAPGAGVLVALPAGACGLLASARIVEYLAGQSAGQCGPCRLGLPLVAGALGRLARGDRDPALHARAERFAGLAAGQFARGACHHPDGTVRLVRSTLRVFADEVRRHLDGGCVARGSR